MPLVTPWASWAEWQECYSQLFTLDDASIRAYGVQTCELWRARGHIPLAVDVTAALTELALMPETMPSGPSEHTVRLAYAMAITRLVNGVVDPLQQGARAASVLRLAQTVGLPAALVECRHECTHNRLPSIDRLRLAVDQALLWLHEQYWLPQSALLAEVTGTLQGCLHAYSNSTTERCKRGEPPLRKHVLACAQEIERSLDPIQVSTHLVPALLDGGFLVPPSPGGACESACGTDGAANSTAAEVADATRWLQWGAVLARLSKQWPQHLFGAALLLGCARRLQHESVAVGPPGLTPTEASRRLLALQSLATRLLGTGGDGSAADGGAAGLVVADPSTVQQAASVAVRAAHGWGRPLVLRALRVSGQMPSTVQESVRRLVSIQEAASGLTRGESLPDGLLTARPSPMRTGDASADLRASEQADGQAGAGAAGLSNASDGALSGTPPSAEALSARAVLPLLVKPICSGSPWLVCSRWAPTAIGAPPPAAAVAAALAARVAEGAVGGSFSSATDPFSGVHTHLAGGGEGALQAAPMPVCESESGAGDLGDLDGSRPVACIIQLLMSRDGAPAAPREEMDTGRAQPTGKRKQQHVATSDASPKPSSGRKKRRS